MNDNTQNLTNALKGDSKAQGLWGEQILERTLEESGLEKGLNYELQKGFRASDGSLKIPDAVIYLPGERNIVIDSKVSLTAYEKFIKEDDIKLKEVAFKRSYSFIEEKYEISKRTRLSCFTRDKLSRLCAYVCSN
jgi:DNA recombination protein RmuC